MNKKKALHKIGYFLYLFVVLFALLEIVLRIYNPFPFRIKANKIVLTANKKYIVDNETIPVIDRHIINTKNSLGFRGPEKPLVLDSMLSIITIGGSTTECQYLNDNKTWSADLNLQLKYSFKNIWLNNAGLAGHSTFGHLVLLKDYIVKLHPKVILFLIGCNDINRDDLNESDKANMTGYYKTIFTFFTKNSEVCSLIENIFRARTAVTKNMSDTYINLSERKSDTISFLENFIAAKLAAQPKYLVGYRSRLTEIIQVCRANNILPVLITQPSLFGIGKDDVTGVNLENFRLEKDQNGKLFWQIQELYNDVTRDLANKNNLLLIDLAHKMPKSTKYFYDIVHFTNEGAQKVSDIINSDLKDYFLKHFSQYKK